MLTEDDHSSIVGLLDVYEDKEILNLVMELFEGVSLYKWMKSELPKFSNREREVQYVFH